MTCDPNIRVKMVKRTIRDCTDASLHRADTMPSRAELRRMLAEAAVNTAALGKGADA